MEAFGTQTPVLNSKDGLPVSAVPVGGKEVPAGTATVIVEALFCPHYYGILDRYNRPTAMVR